MLRYERLERSREIGEGLLQYGRERRVVGHDLGHERRGAAQRGADRGRIDVEHAIGKALVDLGVAVVRLVGVDHHDLPGGAGPQAAAVVERLRAPHGQADGIGLVAMQVVGMPAESRGEALQAAFGLVEIDVVLRSHAQTFKTVDPSCPIWSR